MYGYLNMSVLPHVLPSYLEEDTAYLYLIVRVTRYKEKRISTKIKINPKNDWKKGKFSASFKRTKAFISVNDTINEIMVKLTAIFNAIKDEKIDSFPPSPENIVKRWRSGESDYFDADKSGFFAHSISVNNKVKVHSTQTIYKNYINNFMRFLIETGIMNDAKDDFCVKRFDYKIISSFVEWLLAKKISISTIKYIISRVGYVYKSACRFYNVDADYEKIFSFIEYPREKYERKKGLFEDSGFDPMSEFLRIKKDFVLSNIETDAVNFWLLMAMLRGCRPKDALLFKKDQTEVVDGNPVVWFMEHKKSKITRLYVPITDTLQSILSFYKDKTKYFVSPFLDDMDDDLQTLKSYHPSDVLDLDIQKRINLEIDKAKKVITYHLQNVMQKYLGIKNSFDVLKSARKYTAERLSKSFDMTMAKDMLNHTSKQMTEHYYSGAMQKKIMEAYSQEYGKVVEPTSAPNNVEQMTSIIGKRLFIDRDNLCRLILLKMPNLETKYVDYIDDNTTILLECSTHGIFEGLPKDMAKNPCCPECKEQERKDNRKKGVGAKWFSAVKKKYSGRFSYEKSVFKNMITQLEIECLGCQKAVLVYPKAHLDNETICKNCQK